MVGSKSSDLDAYFLCKNYAEGSEGTLVVCWIISVVITTGR